MGVREFGIPFPHKALDSRNQTAPDRVRDSNFETEQQHAQRQPSSRSLRLPFHIQQTSHITTKNLLLSSKELISSLLLLLQLGYVSLPIQIPTDRLGEELLAARIELQSLHNRPLSVLHGHGEREDQSLGHIIVLSVRAHRHDAVLSLRGALDPIVHVVAGCLGRRAGAGQSAGRDDGLAAELDRGEELAVQIGVVAHHLASRLALHRGEVHIGELGVAVVAPDDDVLDLRQRNVVAELLGGGLAQERLGTVGVQAGHGGEVLARNRGGVLHQHTGVGVGGIGDHQHLDVLVCNSVNRLSGLAEDSSVLGDQVLAEHSLQSGETSDQEGVLNSLEGLHGHTALRHTYDSNLPPESSYS